MNTIETTEKPSVKLEGKLLKNGTDYTVSYSANKNANYKASAFKSVTIIVKVR